MPSRKDSHEGEYEIEPGVFVPRVTKILSCIAKPALVGWARNTARDNTIRVAGELYSAVRKGTKPEEFKEALRKRMTYPELIMGTEDAADIGTALHHRVEAEMRAELGEMVQVPDIAETVVDRDGNRTENPVMLAYLQYHKWRGQHDIEPMKAEVRVISRLGYAGTVDLFAKVDGTMALIDYKTSKAIYPEYKIQVAAYRAAAAEEGMLDPDSPALIVRFPKLAGDELEICPVLPAEQAGLMKVFRAALVLWQGGYGR